MKKESLIEELKKITYPCETKNLEKDTISIYHEFDDDNIEYGCANNYINELNEYEVYIFISSNYNIKPNTSIYKSMKLNKNNVYALSIQQKVNEILEDLISKMINLDYSFEETLSEEGVSLFSEEGWFELMVEALGEEETGRELSALSQPTRHKSKTDSKTAVKRFI